MPAEGTEPEAIELSSWDFSTMCPFANVPTTSYLLLVQFFLFLFAWRRCYRLEFGGFVGLG